MTSLQKRYGFSMTPEELEDYVRREEDVVIAKIKEKLVPCEGVEPVLKKLAEDEQYKLAVVSSSALRRVQASIEKLNQAQFFGKRVYSAATSLPKPTSKPDPAIYLHAMEKLGVQPGECLAVEDSKSGTLSASRAGIRVIGYVGPYPEDERQQMRQVLRESGAIVIMEDWDDFWAILEEIKGRDF